MFKKFDLVWQNGESIIYVILSDLLDIPYFESGCASDFANTPMVLDNPAEWQQTYKGYIAFNTYKQRYEIISENRCYYLVKDKETAWATSYIPFDQATSQNRIRLGLLNLSEELFKLSKETHG